MSKINFLREKVTGAQKNNKPKQYYEVAENVKA